MSIYRFLNRRIIDENSRFFICYDSIQSVDGTLVDNYLIIKPKISHENSIVGVCILPCIDNQFVLMKGWRHQLNVDVWQAPAGFVEAAETPLKCAQRELYEETGLYCSESDIVSLGSYLPDAGLIEGRVALYLATRCVAHQPSFPNEVGTGSLHYFSSTSLFNLLVSSSDIGGSTLQVSLRSLNCLKQLSQTN